MVSAQNVQNFQIDVRDPRSQDPDLFSVFGSLDLIIRIFTAVENYKIRRELIRFLIMVETTQV